MVELGEDSPCLPGALTQLRRQDFQTRQNDYMATCKKMLDKMLQTRQNAEGIQGERLLDMELISEGII